MQCTTLYQGHVACKACSVRLQSNDQKLGKTTRLVSKGRRLSKLESIANTRKLARRLSSKGENTIISSGYCNKLEVGIQKLNVAEDDEVSAGEESDGDSDEVYREMSHASSFVGAIAADDMAGNTAEFLLDVGVNHKQPLQSISGVIVLSLIICMVYADLALDVAAIIEYSPFPWRVWRF